MGGGSVFRGMARLVGAATVGAAAVPTAGAYCHVHPPVSTSTREQESFSALLNHSQKGSCDLNVNLNEFVPSVDVRFEHEEDECSLAEKEEGPPTLRRLVFSPPPTVEEVEEATKELHAALHLSIPMQGSPFEEEQPESMTGTASSDDLMDIKPKTLDKRLTTTSYPHQLGALAAESSSVMQAFQLLQTNSKVQDVVKSLACDPAVWNAVLSNEKVLELTQEDSQESDIEDDDSVLLESDDLDEVTLTSKLYDMMMTSTKVYYGSVKGKVLSILNSMFGSVEKTILLKEGRSAKDKTVTSCMMLAVAVVIVVVMRRSWRGNST